MLNKKVVPFFVTAFIVTVECAISFNSALLPNIKESFLISDTLAQITIAWTLFALGFSGVIYGGISDCLGRRPLFLFSIVIFTISTFATSVTESITVFMIFKILQGIGSGAGWVVGNACLKDIYHGDDYVKVMNLTHAVAGITPAVAPVLGSYLAVIIGWRMCFIIIGVLSALAAISMYFFQPETLQEKKSINLKQIFKNYMLIFTDTKFCKYCSIKVIQVMLIFCEISTLPLVFVDYMDVNPKYYGFYLMPAFLLYVAASSISYKMADRIKIDSILRFGIILIIISNLLLLLLQPFFNLSAVEVMSIRVLSYIGWGFIFGNATSQIVSAIPGKSGITSAMMIALEMLFSGIGVYILGMMFNGTLVPLYLCMIISSAISLTILLCIRVK